MWNNPEQFLEAAWTVDLGMLVGWFLLFQGSEGECCDRLVVSSIGAERRLKARQFRGQHNMQDKMMM